MSELLHRTAVSELEVRAGGDGRTVHGVLVPFETPTPIDVDRNGRAAYIETFKRGSFARTILERGDRVKLLSQHDQTANPLGKAVSLVEDHRALMGDFRVSKTVAGDEALELVRDGALDSFSIGFRAVTDDWDQQSRSVTRTEVALFEASLVTFPAYAGALVGGVRCALPYADAQAQLDELLDPHNPAIARSVDVARRQLDLLRMECR